MRASPIPPNIICTQLHFLHKFTSSHFFPVNPPTFLHQVNVSYCEILHVQPVFALHVVACWTIYKQRHDCPFMLLPLFPPYCSAHAKMEAAHACSYRALNTSIKQSIEQNRWRRFSALYGTLQFGCTWTHTDAAGSHLTSAFSTRV